MKSVRDPDTQTVVLTLTDADRLFWTWHTPKDLHGAQEGVEE